MSKKQISKDKIFLFKFIIKNTNEYSFERMQDYNEEYGFKNYKEFLMHNKKCIENLSKKDAEIYVSLCKKILDNNIYLVDEENFVEWKAYTVYFNKDKKIVFMHPR
jgi:hypothetical protein